MPLPLRIIRTLSLALWVGAIFFFALGVAPVAFHVLPSSHEAGLVVGASLVVLHRLGLICGAACLIVTLPSLPIRPRATISLVAPLLVWLMLTLTLISQFVLLPRMNADRSVAGGTLSSLPLSAPARREFDRLHAISEKLEGSVLLLGLAALVLIAAPPQPSDASPANVNLGLQ